MPKPPNGTVQRWIADLLLAPEQEGCVPWPFSSRAGDYGQAYYEGRLYGAHRLVLSLVTGEWPDRRTQAAHSCGRRDCVNPKHLRWATPKENSADRLEHGTLGNKLTPDQVREIRALAASAPGMSQAAIGKLYGVGDVTVSYIIRRLRWNNLE